MQPDNLGTVLLSAVAVLGAVIGVGVLGPIALDASGSTGTPQVVAADTNAGAGPPAAQTPGRPSLAPTRAMPNLAGPLPPSESQGPDEGGQSEPSPDAGPGDTQQPGEADTPRSEPRSEPRSQQQNAEGVPEPDPEPTVLRVGDSGPEVVELQERLQELGYWLGGVNGTYDHLTRQAVIAFQGVEGLARDGVAGPQVRGALPGAQRPTPAAHHANGLEIDLQRQVLKVVENGQVRWTLHTSTGTGERYTQPDGDRAIAATPTGDYVIERRIDGWRESDLGRLYRPAYFVGGIAIHGYHDVPPYPASHGCSRVSMEAIDFLWSQGYVDVGRPVVVH